VSENENPDNQPLSEEEAKQIAEQIKANALNSPRPSTPKKKKGAPDPAKVAERRDRDAEKEKQREQARAAQAEAAAKATQYWDDPADYSDKDWVEKIIPMIEAAPVPDNALPLPDCTPDPFGLPPIEPASIITDDPDLPVLPCGFYLMYGQTGGGKTITAVSLAQAYSRAHREPPSGLDLNSTAWEDPYIKYALDAIKLRRNAEKVDDAPVVPGFLYVYEARAWPGFFNLPSVGTGKAEDFTGVNMFVDRLQWALTGNAGRTTLDGAPGAPASREAAWDSHRLGAWFRYLNKSRAPSMLFVDSVSLPMRAYAAGLATKIGDQPTRQGEATMSGGLQPSDIAFCGAMQQMAVKANIVLVGLVNNDLVPFADKLEGVTEGAIEVDGAGVCRIRSRRDRSFRRVDCSRHVGEAARFLGYRNPDFKGLIPGIVGL